MLLEKADKSAPTKGKVGLRRLKLSGYQPTKVGFAVCSRDFNRRELSNAIALVWSGHMTPSRKIAQRLSMFYTSGTYSQQRYAYFCITKKFVRL